MTDATGTTATATEYRILRKITPTSPGSPTAWEEVSTVSGGGARSAVRKYLDGLPAEKREGSYVAIPIRSFQPVTVKRREVIDLT